MGGTTAVTIGLGIIKTKVLALLVGASGLGVLSLCQTFQGLAATLAGLGVPTSGVREVAKANSGAGGSLVYWIRRPLVILPLTVGIFLLVLSWALRDMIADKLLLDEQPHAVLALGVGFVAFALSQAQTAWLNGLQRLRTVALITAAGAALGAGLSVALVWRYGVAAIPWAVAGTSIIAFALSSAAWWFGDQPARSGISRAYKTEVTHGLLVLGLPLMAAGLIRPATQLAVKLVVSQELGGASLGYYHAAWVISTLYVHFVLSARSVDYLPRLSEAHANPQRLNRLVNQQAEVSLLLAGPVIVGMLAWAPIVVRVLFEGTFVGPAVSILAWQLIGDVFMIPAWTLRTVYSAQGKGTPHLFFATLWSVPYLAMIWLGIGRWGLPICGIAFLVSYILYFAGLTGSLKKTIGFTWDRRISLLMAGLLVAVGCLRWIDTASQHVLLPQAGVVFGVGIYSFWRIRRELGRGEAA